MDEAPGLRGEEPASKNLIYLRGKALARLHRVMQGLMKQHCPQTNWDCYWCGATIYEVTARSHQVQYTGNNRGVHGAGCPWNEVIEYLNLEDEWDARYGKRDQREADEAGLAEGQHEPPTD